MDRLRGKVAIITGSNQNIGRAVAELFGHEGAKVIVNGAHNQAKLDETVAAIRNTGGEAIGVLANVSEPDEVERLVAVAVDTFGQVDIAVSNVGVRLRLPFEEITIDAWRETINTNLNSAFYLAHYVLPGMKARQWGRIINVSGIDGFTGQASQRAANVTAKAGMHGLTKAIAHEFGPFNITSNTVVPGAIDTIRDMRQYTHVNLEAVRQEIPLKRLGLPKEVAEACLFCAAESGSFLSGQPIHVNGGGFMP